MQIYEFDDPEEESPEEEVEVPAWEERVNDMAAAL